MKTDMQLHDDVVAELTWDPRVMDEEIAVAVRNGVVTLSGSVPNFATRLAAERAVERIGGVRAVANDIKVVPPRSNVHSDTDIAHQAVNALTWDTEVPDEQVRVGVANGWITLEGEVEWRYQKDAAERVVRNLAGVLGVTNDIRLKPKVVNTLDVSGKIKDALRRRAERAADDIVVETAGDVVTLKGHVHTFADRRAAEVAAWAAPGVKTVRDEIAVI